MSVIILQRLGIMDWRVQCTICSGVYHTTGWKGDIVNVRKGCSDCQPKKTRDGLGRFLPGKVGA